MGIPIWQYATLAGPCHAAGGELMRGWTKPVCAKVIEVGK